VKGGRVAMTFEDHLHLGFCNDLFPQFSLLGS
jgi:hypothetical protein